jgi:hypothetical protein
MFLLLPFLESMKNAKLYVLCLQSSAASPQASDQIWCSFFIEERRKFALQADFACLEGWVGV